MKTIKLLLVIFLSIAVTACGLYGNGGAHTPGSLDTSLDSSFDTDGKLTTAIGSGFDSATAIAIQSDGKIIAAGASYNGYSNDFALARYNTDGSLDTNFDSDGKLTAAFGKSENFASAIALQSDGKIVAAGTSWNDTNFDFALARYNTDGSLDTSFDSDGKLTTEFGMDDFASAIALQSDGKIVAAGTSWTGSISVFALARYNTDGSRDASFGTDGKLTTIITGYDVASAIALQSDGKIVVTGASINKDSSVFALARYNTDGSLDSGFGTNGKLMTTITGYDEAKAIALQSDGKIVVAGSSRNISSHVFALARYNTDGVLDASFDTDGKLTTYITGSDFANAVAIQSDGKIVAAGRALGLSPFLSDFTFSDFALARYNTDGSLDTSFNSDGVLKTSFVTGTNYTDAYANAIAIQSDGKIVAAGHSSNHENKGFALVRYWP